MNYLDLRREQLAEMISRYEREHGVKLEQVLRCAANTGQVSKFFGDLHGALTKNQTIPNLGDYVRLLYTSNKRYPPA